MHYQSLNYIFENILFPFVKEFHFRIYKLNSKEAKQSFKNHEAYKQTENLLLQHKAAKLDFTNVSAEFDSLGYLQANNKNLYFDFINKKNFIIEILKEIIANNSLLSYNSSSDNSNDLNNNNEEGTNNENNKFQFGIFGKLESIFIEVFAKFIGEKLEFLNKNAKNFLKTTKEIKRLITPNSDNITDISEPDFIIMLEINFNSIVSFFADFQINNTRHKHEIIEIINTQVSKLRHIVEDFFEDNLITLIYPSNEIKEDFLCDFRKFYCDKTLKFYEQIYSLLDLSVYWDNYEKIIKVIFILILIFMFLLN